MGRRGDLMTLKQLSTKIYNAVKAYCKKLAELQREVIEFNSDLEKEMWGDKK